METSDRKTAKSTSREYFEVSVVKISARSDEVRGWLSVVQSSALHENVVLRKMQNKFEKCLVQKMVENSFFNDSMKNLICCS